MIAQYLTESQVQSKYNDDCQLQTPLEVLRGRKNAEQEVFLPIYKIEHIGISKYP